MEDDFVRAAIERVQQHVFERRARLKDPFRDYDELHCGRCTRQQFVRAVNQTVPFLQASELEALADHYTEDLPIHMKPQVVNYNKFCQRIEEVFTIANLEKQPMRQVPRPGSMLSGGGGRMKPRPFSDPDDEARVIQILRRARLLSETRGVNFATCFEDCERAPNISMVCPRRSGKTTVAQFKQHFPFVKDFNESDISLLARRYRIDSGYFHYQAMAEDIARAEPISTISARTITSRPASVPTAPRTLRSPRLPGPNCRSFGTERVKRAIELQETLESVDSMAKLRAVINERRLRIHDCFLDFDPLRKGFCTINQLRTVLTVLGIEVDPKDFETIRHRFCDNQDLFYYREFIAAVSEVLPAAAEPAMVGSYGEAPHTPSTRVRYKAPLNDYEQAWIAELETRIRQRVHMRRLPMKSSFQDFDKSRRGHVTRNQFHRIMDMMQIELSESDAELLCQAYCDTNNGHEFNYVDFCARNDIKWGSFDTTQAAEAKVWPPKPSKYFDISGRIVPLDMRGPASARRPVTR